MVSVQSSPNWSYQAEARGERALRVPFVRPQRALHQQMMSMDDRVNRRPPIKIATVDSSTVSGVEHAAIISVSQSVDRVFWKVVSRECEVSKSTRGVFWHGWRVLARAIRGVAASGV